MRLILGIFVFIPCFFVESNDQLKYINYKTTAEDIRRLIKNGADPDVRDEHNEQRTPIFTELATPDNLRALLEGGADPNIRDNLSEPALFYAIRNAEKYGDLIGAVDILLEFGADPDARNNEGKTFLHRTNNFNIAKRLIDAGANIRAKDIHGQIPRVVKAFFPHLLEESSQNKEQTQTSSQDDSTSCRYTSESSQINSTQCGQRSICMAEVSCKFKIGIAPNTAQIERTFQVACSGLSNGQCPGATACALDRSFMETKNNNVIEDASDSNTTRKSSGVR